MAAAAGAVRVGRAQVIGYRVAAQQLDRSGTEPARLAVLDIGVQDAAGEQARLAFDARLPGCPPAGLIGPEQPLALVWSVRGAPHVHRRAELDALAGALYPLSEADATQRLNETGPGVRRAGIAALEQYATAVAALRAAVPAPLAKGAASTAVTRAVPPAMRRDCRACRTSHISDSALRTALLAAGLELEPGTAPPVLRPRRRAALPAGPDLAALSRLVRAYLALLGPATPAQVAGYLEARRSDVQAAWPADLVEVRVDGAAGWLPPERLAALRAAPEPDLVRLLGAFDPYLQARDRDLIVPDRAAHKTLWPVLGRPGAVFVDGEVVGTWRPKAAGRSLRLLVEQFVPLPPPVWEQLEEQARRVAAVRGYPAVTLQRAG